MQTIKLRSSFIQTINTINQEIFDLIAERNDNFSILVKNLHLFVHNRTDSLFVLVQHNCLWDADILLRPIAEASVKIAFISCGSVEERNDKCKIFWGDLAEINTLKRSRQTRELFNSVNIESEALSKLILDEETEQILGERWTKSKRQKVEQSWAYNEMIKVIATTLDQEELLNLARNFTQSSHLIHADESALGVIHDRLTREEKDRTKQIILHEIRLFSDCVALNSWNLFTVSNALNIEVKLEIKKILDEFYIDLRKFQKSIYKS